MYWLLAICLLPIVYEDFRYRAIHWIWLVLFSVLLLAYSPPSGSSLFGNFLFIALQLLLLSLYFSIKHRKWINITQEYLGIGDILFFLMLCLLFSTDGLMLFFTGSILISLIGYLLFQALAKTKTETIPLAGCMAIPLIVLLCWASIHDLDLSTSILFL